MRLGKPAVAVETKLLDVKVTGVKLVGQRDDIPRWYGTGDHQEEGINISVVRPGKERRGGPAGYRDRPRFREVGRRWRAELAPDVKLDRTTGPVIAVAPTGAESASTAIDAKKPSFNPAKRVHKAAFVILLAQFVKVPRLRPRT
jgi:hypothetical protein